MSKFLKKHWMDILVILLLAALIALLFYSIGQRFNFANKWAQFYKHFITNKGYKRVLSGMKNTGLIAVSGLGIGIVIGTLIAAVMLLCLSFADLAQLRNIRAVSAIDDPAALEQIYMAQPENELMIYFHRHKKNEYH